MPEVTAARAPHSHDQSTHTWQPIASTYPPTHTHIYDLKHQGSSNSAMRNTHNPLLWRAEHPGGLHSRAQSSCPMESYKCLGDSKAVGVSQTPSPQSAKWLERSSPVTLTPCNLPRPLTVFFLLWGHQPGPLKKKKNDKAAAQLQHLKIPLFPCSWTELENCRQLHRVKRKKELSSFSQECAEDPKFQKEEFIHL